ncbi:histidine phosphatase family protein [Stutzerimonas zhaodongensis]|uniref:histidine phosphatase family protein n=1 Tax=Stutzerimonas zhaodongensis TaxID=1176257 RepID=UPI003F70BDD0
MRVAALVTLLLWASIACADLEQAWSELRDGQAVLLMRHASAPGIGDPPGFVLEDCDTQRNLDEQGRLQAQRWGELLRAKGVTQPRVFSSRWCRALETAERMRFDAVEPLPLLDSFFVRKDQKDTQTENLRAFINSLSAGSTVILITHQVNITALTGVFPRSGEALFLALPLTDSPKIQARILPP